MADFKEILDTVFANGWTKRFAPKSINGGVGWMVWDREKLRFLKDEEVAGIDPNELLPEYRTASEAEGAPAARETASEVGKMVQ